MSTDEKGKNQTIITYHHGLSSPVKYPIGSMYAIYGNIYHQYTPSVSIYTIHGSYGYHPIIIYRHLSCHCHCFVHQHLSPRSIPSHSANSAGACHYSSKPWTKTQDSKLGIPSGKHTKSELEITIFKFGRPPINWQFSSSQTVSHYQRW